jgi:hypothetical protein
MVESVERELIGVEQRDTETTYRFSRFRRNRRFERVSEVVKLLSDRNVWDGYYPVKFTDLELCRSVGATGSDCDATSPPIVPLRC